MSIPVDGLTDDRQQHKVANGTEPMAWVYLYQQIYDLAQSCDNEWFGSTQDESSEVAMALGGAIAGFRVAEFTRWNGVKLSGSVAVGIRPTSGLADGFDRFLIDSSLKERLPDDPGVEAAAFDSGDRYLREEIKR